MGSQQGTGRQWLEEARVALADARARSHPANAWEALQERDAEGNPRGSLPYSVRAFEEFHAAHRQNPDDIGIVHHLAIAHHARAWDLELAGDAGAATEWEEALGYWRAIAYSREFWAAMERKLHACQPEADAEPLREAQRNLLEDLLNVHVEFIRHYCEAGAPLRANTHVRIIQRAKIPPAVKKRLESKVLGAMTASVPEAKAAGQYESALLAIERFLDLFPEHPPAIRMVAEVGKAWLSQMSWQHDWDSILRLHGRISPQLARGAKLGELSADPLSRTATEELALEFMMHGADRAWPRVRGAVNAGTSPVRRDDALGAFELALYWGRLAAPRASGGSELRDALGSAVLGHSSLLRDQAIEAYSSPTDHRRGLAAAIEVYRKLTAELQEASQFDSLDPKLSGYINSALEAWRGELAALESEQTALDLGWGDTQ